MRRGRTKKALAFPHVQAAQCHRDHSQRCHEGHGEEEKGNMLAEPVSPPGKTSSPKKNKTRSNLLR